ncbi:helix-turn-helix domain-containing protein [Lactobacillus crispatus]|uniref:Helix-turn-helix domain-containing protein n=1 Tax=Lactobacillus crispatus TaxID=47770 RepID=A0A7X4HP59_9LACO|nr:helix-turn-helix transcriptional regulator [Lactobacillus crispatus]MYN53854.1 helix-turn-helix domain-containing protein [Lactobacillus crispatus]
MNRIKELRQKNKLSQIELANKIKASNQAISAYENGSREPKEPTWQALANFFNVSVDYLKGYGYSKDYIYQQLDDAYKEKWKDPTGQIMGGGFDKVVDAYLAQKEIKKPSKIDMNFWKTNFNYLFETPNIRRLLTTKDKYSNDDIKLILAYTIFLNFTGLKQITDYFSKTNHHN